MASSKKSVTPKKPAARPQRKKGSPKGSSPKGTRGKAAREALIAARVAHEIALYKRRERAAAKRLKEKSAFAREQVRKLDTNRRARERRDAIKNAQAVLHGNAAEQKRRAEYRQKKLDAAREKRDVETARRTKRDQVRERRIAKLPPRERKKARDAYAKKDRSEASKKGWFSRRVHKAREKALGSFEGGGGLHGAVREDWYVLKAKMAARDPSWLAFIAACEAEGWSLHEAADEWFSPEM